MAQIKYSELFQGLKAYILDLIQTAGGGSGPYSPSPHGLFSSHHTGSLADSQAPQFLKTDGSRQLIGNLSVADGVTVDGVDISGFKSSYDLHVLAPAATAHAGVGVHNHQSNAEGSKLDHGLALLGLLDDDHTQYAHAEGSGTRRAYEAGRLTKSILAGDGLTGGGQLVQDRTISIDFARNNTWTGAQTFTVAINAQGGINVGTATGATGGNIFGSGVIRMEGTGNSYVMGDFGIGNNNPSEKLDIDGNLRASGVAKIDGTGNSYVMGNIGIGKNNPFEKLDVDGNGKFAGVIKVDGTDHSYIASKLAIGKTSIIPNLALDISGNTKMSGVLQVDGSGYSYVQGQLGVGMTTSTYTLDVNGTANILTSLRVPIINAPQSLTVNPTSEILLQPGNNLVKLMSSASIQSDGYASQTTGWRISYAGEGDFRYLFTDDLHTKSFIVDLEQALAGGQIICKSVAVLAQDFTLPTAGNSANFFVKDLPSAPDMAVFVSGDFVAFRQFSRSGGSLTISWAWGTVSNYQDQADGTQRWTFTRHSTTPGSASGTIYKDALVLDFGTSGNGFYEVNAIDGIYGIDSPYAQVVTWQTHPATQTINARLGNLRGIFSANNEFGLYAGSGTGQSDKFLRLSNSGAEFQNIPINVYDGANVTINLNPSEPAFRVGGSQTSLTYSSGVGIWMGKDGGTYKFRAGDPGNEMIAWNGSALRINADANNYLLVDGQKFEFYANNTEVLEINNTPSVTIGNIANNNIVINNTNLRLRSGSTDKVVLDTSGNITIYSSPTNYFRATSSLLEFYANSAKVMEIANTPSITIGQVASEQSNVLISSGEIRLRNNTTTVMQLTSAGVLNINDPGGTTVIQFNSSGNNKLLNKLLLDGTSSALAIGNPPPTNASNGTGIWIDRTGLYGLSDGTSIIKIDASNGYLYSGTSYLTPTGLYVANNGRIVSIYQGSNTVGEITSTIVNYSGVDLAKISISSGLFSPSSELVPDYEINNSSYWTITGSGTYNYSFGSGYVNMYVYGSPNWIKLSSSSFNISSGTSYLVRVRGYAIGKDASCYVTVTIRKTSDDTLLAEHSFTFSTLATHSFQYLSNYSGSVNVSVTVSSNPIQVDFVSVGSQPDYSKIDIDPRNIKFFVGSKEYTLPSTGGTLALSNHSHDTIYSGSYSVSTGSSNGITLVYSGAIKIKVYGSTITLNNTYIDIKAGTDIEFMIGSNRKGYISSGSRDGMMLTTGDISNTVYRQGESFPLCFTFPSTAALLMPLTYEGTRGLWMAGGFTAGTQVVMGDRTNNNTDLSGNYSSFIDKGAPGMLRTYQLNGSSNYFYRTADRGLNSNNWFSFGAWVYISSMNRMHGIARCGSSTVAWSVHAASGNYFEFWYYDTTNTVRYVPVVYFSNTGWHYVGFIYGWVNSSSYIIKFFCDGTWTSASSAPYQMRVPSGNFELGRAGVGNDYLHGGIGVAWMSGPQEQYVSEFYHVTKGFFGH